VDPALYRELDSAEAEAADLNRQARDLDRTHAADLEQERKAAEAARIKDALAGDDADAIREAEGRDPDPNFDPHFWDAYTRILKNRAGTEYSVESAEEYSNFQKRRNSDGWIEPEPGADLEEHVQKQIAEGRAPAWARGLMARRSRR